MKVIYALLGVFVHYLALAQPLPPIGAIPSPSQLKWHSLEYYMFVHFGPNTFTNQEWGHGDENPAVFNPSQLDCRQWAATAKQAGMKGIIITAKHHDGFCLWPSHFSTHTVRESSWRNGSGDVLKELSEACREQGLLFGVYLSPWDRNHPDYGTEKYNQVFVNMLGEVLQNYGPVFEQWFDGANGEGPNGRKQIYDWQLFNSTVYKYQPQAIIFSDGGPGCRWVGNEDGYAGETNWCTLNAEKVYPGYPGAKELTQGHEDGSTWVPAECDVSIRPGWFYTPDTDGKVKSLEQLMNIYYGSIGRGGNLLLNVPADRRGLIPREDSIRLMEFRDRILADFHENLAGASTTRSKSRKGYPARQAIDGDERTAWAPPGNQVTGELQMDFKSPVKFNRMVLQEDIALGQRVKSFTVEVSGKDGFREVARGTTIGHKRILRIPDSETDRIRIRILNSKAVPLISEIGIYRASD